MTANLLQTAAMLEECLTASRARGLETPFPVQPLSRDSSERARRYRAVVATVREIASRLEPGILAVVSKGDPELVDLGGRLAWHFPQTPEGIYAGHHPTDSVDAIEQLERIRLAGARFLVFPQTAFWWFSHYPEFARHLEDCCRCIVSEQDSCLIYELLDVGDARHGTVASGTPAVSAGVDEGRTADELLQRVRALEAIVARLERPLDVLEIVADHAVATDHASVAVTRVSDDDPDLRVRELSAMALAEVSELASLFDSAFYLRSYPDVAASGMDPLVHYLTVGVSERRDPNPLFDTSFYLATNPDVEMAGVDPLLHYLLRGAAEGRDPSATFDSLHYLGAHADVLYDHQNPLAHFLATEPTASLLSEILHGDPTVRWSPLVKQLVLSVCHYPPRRGRGPLRELESPRSKSPSRVTEDETSPSTHGVVVVSHDAEVNGAQLIALSISREFGRRSTAPHVVLLKRGGPLRDAFARVAPTVVLDGSLTDDFDDLLVVLRRLGVRAAICNTMVAGDVAARLKSGGLTVISAIHELPGAVNAYGTPELLKHAISHSDHVVFPAGFVRDQLFETFSIAHDSSWVCPQGILRPNPFLAEREFARLEITKEFDIPEDAVIVMGCGLASQRKGFDLFIRLASSVRGPSSQPVHFVWVGPSDGVFTDWCRRDMHKAGLEDRVHFAGLRDHPGLFYVASDIFVLTSREDPFPTVCLEAMEAGVPVVAFAGVGGIGEVLSPAAGVFVPYLDVGAMARAVARLAVDARRRARLGRGGRAAVAELSMEKYVDFFAELISSRPSRVDAVDHLTDGALFDARQ